MAVSAVCGVQTAPGPAESAMNTDGHGLHLLRAQVSAAMLGSVSGPHARLLCSLLPKGKVRVVVFMG